MKSFFTRFIKNNSGATAIEYGLIAALIAVVLIAAFGSGGSVSGGLTGAFENIGSSLNTATDK
jgi:pilus assembly protein Flp/PilA